MSPEVRTVVVFADGPGGGNPAPVVVDAAGMSDEQMQQVARTSGHESAFVLPAGADQDADLALRFWVPDHEMEMCGHATVGAVWLLDRLGRLPGAHVRVSTRSGPVEAVVRQEPDGSVEVEVSQPPGRVEPVPASALGPLLQVLGLREEQLAGPVVNATTSRTKTLVPLAGEDVLDGLRPDLAGVGPVCDLLGSTGLYPYALREGADQEVAARQFPRSSGYPEDPATGIAAAALLFGLLDEGRVERSERALTVRQGRAMGRPSAIRVRLRLEGDEVTGCWLGGPVREAADPA